jgi:hypothetical protein
VLHQMTWPPHSPVYFRRRQRWPPRFAFLGNYIVFCFFYLLFLTLVPQLILGFITYSREELLDIRATSTHHHYDQEYDFPKVDTVLRPPPRRRTQPANQNNDAVKGADEAVFWSGSGDGHMAHRSRAYNLPMYSLLTTRLIKSEQG